MQIEGTANSRFRDSDDERSAESTNSSIQTIDRLTDIITRSSEDIQRLQNELKCSHDEKQAILKDSIAVVEEMKRFKAAFEAEKSDRLYMKKTFEESITILHTEKADLLSAANKTMQSLQSAANVFREKHSGLLLENEALKVETEQITKERDSLRKEREEWQREKEEMLARQTKWENEKMAMQTEVKKERLRWEFECDSFASQSKVFEQDSEMMEIERIEFDSMKRVLVGEMHQRLSSMKVAFAQTLFVVCPLAILLSHKFLSTWEDTIDSSCFESI